MSSPNTLRWDGRPGRYEVYYLSATDRGTGSGLWIRYTLHAPLEGPATAALWFTAMDPDDPGSRVGRKAAFPIERLSAKADPFELRIADAVLADDGMRGGFGDARWELAWEPGRAYEPVHPLLARAGLARTVLALPHADVAVSGTVAWAGRTVELRGARGGQAHLWGSRHADRWAWAHAGDFEGEDGSPRPDAFLDGVSVYVPALGRELGPSTPVVGRIGGRDVAATGPLRIARAPSAFGLTSWSFEVRDGRRRLECDVEADRDALVGVTYHDPDGTPAYCYNSEVATMRVVVWEGDRLVDRLVAPRRAHFEYAQREPVPGLPLHVR